MVNWMSKWDQGHGYATYVVAAVETCRQWDVGERDGDVGQGQEEWKQSRRTTWDPALVSLRRDS